MPNVAGNKAKIKELQQHASDCTNCKNYDTVFLAKDSLLKDIT